MNLLEEFQRKSNLLSGEDVHEGIEAAIRHVKSAEKHLFRARTENDDDLLNDVIYRTNQAFEGMLKEAYAVLTGRDATKKSPNEIEMHLLKEEVLPPRVLELFTNYRKKWRNPSTHDHKLFFGDQEALLAITNVTAFASILLDQIIETVSFNREKEEIESKKDKLKSKISSYGSASFKDQLLGLLESFSTQLLQSKEPLTFEHEAEISGRLSAFLDSVDPDIHVLHQRRIRYGSRTVIPDLVLFRGDEGIPVELKRPGLSERGVRSAQDQVLSYMEAGDYAFGVVYVPPSFPNQKSRTSETIRQARGRTAVIYTVAPEVEGRTLTVKVEDREGAPITETSILAVAANGTYQKGKTDEKGQAKLTIPQRRLLTVFCSHEGFPAHIERDFDPVDDLAVTLPRVENAGSIVCPDGSGYVPGLEGRLNPIRDTADRLYLYADNIAIEGGKPQPAPFELGVPFEVEDKNGRVFSLKIVEVIGRSSLLEFSEK